MAEANRTCRLRIAAARQQRVELAQFPDNEYRRVKRVRCGNMARFSGIIIVLNRGERLATTGTS